MPKYVTSARDDLLRTARYRPKRREQAGMGAAPFGGAFPDDPQVRPLGFLRPQAARELQKQEEKLIPTLQAEGHEVMASQYGLETLKGDVNATIHTFGRVSGPIVLVGHLRRMRRSM
jgi:hypothetical protein